MGGLLAFARRLAGSFAFRAVVTIALLAFVLGSVDWPTVSEKVRTGEPGYGLLAIITVMAALSLGAVRWGALLRAAEIHLPLRELLRIYAVTSFANAFLPTSVGGDVARPLMVSRRGPLLVRAATTVFVERLLALVALVLVAWVGAAFVPSAVSRGSFTALAVISAGMVGGALLVAFRPSILRTVLGAVIPARFSSHLDQAATVVRGLKSSPGLLLMVLAQSVAFQALVTVQIVLLAKMIGLDLSFGLAAVALALVTLATLLPISIGGFGVREGSYVVILAGGGIGHTDAVLISLLSVVVLFLATLPGAVELIRHGFKPAAGTAEATP